MMQWTSHGPELSKGAERKYAAHTEVGTERVSLSNCAPRVGELLPDAAVMETITLLFYTQGEEFARNLQRSDRRAHPFTTGWKSGDEREEIYYQPHFSKLFQLSLLSSPTLLIPALSRPMEGHFPLRAFEAPEGNVSQRQ